MKLAFFQALCEMAESDDRIVLVTGDLGFGVVENFRDRFPDRYVNAGVAEQNMTGIAAGMAQSGATVFTYSIANFPTLRCLEQLRNDVCAPRANVKVVSVGAGFSYGSLGLSHHATEDIGVLRAIPNLGVVTPADDFETRALTRAMCQSEGPICLRLGRSGEPDLHSCSMELPPGTIIEMDTGSDVAIFATGSILAEVLVANRSLASLGIEASVYSVPWLAPFDTGRVSGACSQVRLVVTVEEHSVIGGLGSAVAELLSASVSHPPVMRIGIDRTFTEMAGDQAYLRSVHGLDAASIAKAVTEKLGELNAMESTVC